MEYGLLPAKARSLLPVDDYRQMATSTGRLRNRRRSEGQKKYGLGVKILDAEAALIDAYNQFQPPDDALGLLALPAKAAYALGQGALTAIEDFVKDPSDPKKSFDAASIVAGGGGLLSRATDLPKGAVLGTFAGRNARTAPMDKLESAQAMTKAGASRDKIWNETGWFKDADDNWKFEIDDSKATLFPQAAYRDRSDVGEMMTHGKLYSAYKDVQTIPTSPLTNADPRIGAQYAFPAPGRAERIEVNPNNKTDEIKSSLLHEVQHSIQDRENFGKGGSLQTAPASVVQGINEKLKNLGSVSLLNKFDDAAKDLNELRSLESIAYFRDIKQPRHLFGTSTWYENSTEVRGLLGAMPKRSGPAKKEWIKKAGNIIADRIENEHIATYGARVNRVTKSPASAYSLYKNAHKFSDEKKSLKNATKRAEYAANKFDRQKINKILGLLDQKRKFQDKDFSKMTEEEKYNLYQRLAGEAEARNVQTRKDFTPEQRSARPPWTTLDVPENELIVKKFY